MIKRKKIHIWIISLLLIVVALIVAAIIITPPILNSDRIKTKIQAEFNSATGGEVTYQEIGILVDMKLIHLNF